MQIRLKELRKAAGLTQAQLADQLQVKLPTYRTWERGTTMMNLEQAYNCALALNCTIDEIAGMPAKPRSYADAGQRQINEQYEGMNARGRTQAVDQVDNIHANPKNRKSDLDTTSAEGRSA